MDYRSDAQVQADQQRRQAEEQSAAELLNRAIIAVDRLPVSDRTQAALATMFTNWARIPRSAPRDVLNLARAVVDDAQGA